MALSKRGLSARRLSKPGLSPCHREEPPAPTEPLTLSVGPGPPGMVALTVTGMIPGELYLLQESSDLQEWFDIQEIDSNTAQPVLVAMSGPQQFFRVGGPI